MPYKLQHDILGAQKVGMHAVYKHDGNAQVANVCPDAAIAHLSELPALIEKWSEADSTP